MQWLEFLQTLLSVFNKYWRYLCSTYVFVSLIKEQKKRKEEVYMVLNISCLAWNPYSTLVEYEISNLKGFIPPVFYHHFPFYLVSFDFWRLFELLISYNFPHFTQHLEGPVSSLEKPLNLWVLSPLDLVFKPF